MTDSEEVFNDPSSQTRKPVLLRHMSHYNSVSTPGPRGHTLHQSLTFDRKWQQSYLAAQVGGGEVEGVRTEGLKLEGVR